MDHPLVKVAPDGSLLLNFGASGEKVELAAVSADGSRVLTVRSVDRAHVWGTNSGQQLGELIPHSPLEGTSGNTPWGGTFRLFIESAALNADGTLALLGLNDGTAGVFRVADGARLNVLSPPDEAAASRWGVVRAVSWSRGGRYVLVGFGERRVGVWSADGGQLVAMLQMPRGKALVSRLGVRNTLISSVSSSDDERFIFAGAVDMTACLWDLATGEVVLDATEHAEEKLTLFDGPLGPGWTTSAGNVWAGTPPRNVLSTGEHWVETAVTADRVLARCADGSVSLWSMNGQREALVPAAGRPQHWALNARTLAMTAKVMAFAHSGQGVTLRGRTGSLELIRDKQLVHLELKGKRLATSGWGEVSWPANDGHSRHRVAVPEGDSAIALSADGSLLAVGEIGTGRESLPRRVRLYETSTGRVVLELQAHDHYISKLVFSPDGCRLASVGHELRVWDLSQDPARLAFEVDVEKAWRATCHFLADGRLLVLDLGRARVLEDGRVRASHEVPYGFETPWCLTQDERSVMFATSRGLVCIDLETGATTSHLAPFVAPSFFPPQAQSLGARQACALWRTEHGVFIHQSDGPRGWVLPMAMGFGGGVVVPTKTGAVVVSTDEAAEAVRELPFTGRLRASRVSADRVVLVNDEGRVFVT